MADLKSVDEIVDEVGAFPEGHTVLLARGRIRANPARARYHVVDVTEGAPIELHKAWIALPDAGTLASTLDADTVRDGALEPKLFWWTHDDRPWRLWDNEGLLWRLDEEALLRLRPEGRWSPDEIEAVEAYVGDDWVEQGVRLLLRDGGTVTVAVNMNESPKYNIEYDGMSLDWDTSWCRQVARHLAERLGAEYRKST